MKDRRPKYAGRTRRIFSRLQAARDVARKASSKSGREQIRRISAQLDEAGVRQLSELWGSRLPTRDEFKRASKEGRVRVNKAIANEAIHWRGMPTAHMIIFGLITLWAAFLAPPAAIATYFLAGVSIWWIPASFALAWYLIKVSRDGQCDGIRYGAEQDEQLYTALLQRGAFLFGPTV